MLDRTAPIQYTFCQQVNFVENSLLDGHTGSFFTRAELATGGFNQPYLLMSSSSDTTNLLSWKGERGIYLGVWEPLSLWVKMAIAQFTVSMVIYFATPFITHPK